MPVFDPLEVARWCRGAWEPAAPPALCGVSHDTRTLTAGNLFFALRGPRFDGHEFVTRAFERGAAGAVVRREARLAADPGGPLLRVGEPGAALREIATGYRLKQAVGIVAVTGSAGKSTVKEMTAQMLSTAMATARSPGNWNNEIGLPLSLLAMEPEAKAGVFELGTNHPGEIAILSGMLKPDWGVVTNIGPVHMEFFDSIEAIAREKASLLAHLPADGAAVLNADSDFFGLLRDAAPGRVIRVSVKAGADYHCLPDAGTGELEIREARTGDAARLPSPLPGAHNAMNAAQAAAVARGHGVSWEGVRSALAAYRPLPMRWEERHAAGIRIINDAYNANPMNMRAALRAFAQEPGPGSKWLVLGGMLELGRMEDEAHAALGGFAGQGAWEGIVVVGVAGEKIAAGAERAGFASAHLFRCATATDAAEVIRTRVKAGGSVLVKASRGFRLEQVVEDLVSGNRGA